MDTDRKKRLLLENLFSPLLRLLSSLSDNRWNSCLLIRVHLCASVVLNQSTNMNSFESSNTCAYFSQGLSGLGGGSGGPLKSFFALHSPAYSPEEAPVGCSFHLMTGAHLKSSLLRLALKSTTKSIVSSFLTPSVGSSYPQRPYCHGEPAGWGGSGGGRESASAKTRLPNSTCRGVAGRWKTSR